MQWEVEFKDSESWGKDTKKNVGAKAFFVEVLKYSWTLSMMSFWEAGISRSSPNSQNPKGPEGRRKGPAAIPV